VEIILLYEQAFGVAFAMIIHHRLEEKIHHRE